MTKRDMITRIAEETGLLQQQVRAVIQRALRQMADAVSRGERVELRKFGVFEARAQGSRIGRNPNSPAQTVVIPPRFVVKFKPAAEVRKALLKLIPPPKPVPAPAPPPASQGAAESKSAAAEGTARREETAGPAAAGLETGAKRVPKQGSRPRAARPPRPKPSAGQK